MASACPVGTLQGCCAFETRGAVWIESGKLAKSRNELPMPKKTAPTFEVRFVAPGLLPEKVSLGYVSKALSAVQDLASGRDPLEVQVVPPEKTIGLISVRRGSAVYTCVSRAPEEAKANLAHVGALLSCSEEPHIGGTAWSLRYVRLNP